MNRRTNVPHQQTAAPTPGAPAGTTALAPIPGALAALGDFQRPANIAPVEETGPGFSPYFFIYSGKGSKVGPITQQLGPQRVGAALMCVGGDTYRSMDGTGLLVVKEVAYWAACDDQYKELAAFETEQPRGKTVDGRFISETILAVLLHLPATQPLHPELAPAVVSVSRLRGAQARLVRGHLDAVERTMTPEWAREAGNGPIAAKFPPRYRLVSTFQGFGGTSKKGRAYVGADATPATISMAQLQAFGEWAQSEQHQAALVAALGEFDQKAAEIAALIEQTRKAGK